MTKDDQSSTYVPLIQTSAALTASVQWRGYSPRSYGELGGPPKIYSPLQMKLYDWIMQWSNSHIQYLVKAVSGN